MKVKIGILGLGKLGRACIEQIEKRSNEFELVAVFSRRKLPGSIHISHIEKYRGKIDVFLVCVGSSTDAPLIVPTLAKMFSIVDSYDNHGKMQSYIELVSEGATATTAVVATGWDPGIMSLMRIYFRAILPNGEHESYWGKGVSLGHTNAIKSIKGVQDAIQFTVPDFENKTHIRECFVVAGEKDHVRIEKAIKTMPDYFAGYKTEVTFISAEEFQSKYSNRHEHAGMVIATNNNTNMEYKHSMESNPQFTASIMLAYAKANHALQKEKRFGCFTVADVAPKYLVEGVTQLL